MKLSILIPTLPEEYSIHKLNRLMAILKPQVERHSDVEIRINDAGRFMSTGAKRNELIKNSDSDYFVQVDCDDLVPMYYVDELLKAIEQGPDVVSFIGEMITDGKKINGFTIKLGSKYEERNGHYYRFPNHLCCYKRSVVGHVKFPDLWIQEDYRWAQSIQHLLKTEIHIDKKMYTYDFVSNKPKK